MKTIPITRPCLGKEEIAAVKKVLFSRWLSQGEKTRLLEENFAGYVGSRYACAVSSCTSALHLALLAAGVKPANLVITASHSFIATANSIRYCQAEPLFVDIEPNTFNLSASSLRLFLERECEFKQGNLFYKNIRKLIVKTSPLANFWNSKNDHVKKELGRVAAVLIVHQMGMPADMGAILPLVHKFKLPLIEDAACAIGSEIKIGPRWEKIGRPHGDIACFSFHPRKIVTTGEGGMLTTNNKHYDSLFRLMRQHGMSVSDVARHNAKKTIFEKYLITGYNYRMTDLQAAIGLEQLKRLSLIIKKRRDIAIYYREALNNIPWLATPMEPENCRSNWQSYPVLINKNAPLKVNALMQYLLDAGIATRRGIMNAHQELPYRDLHWQLPLSETARDYVVLLPIFPSMSKSQLKYVVNMLKKIK